MNDEQLRQPSNMPAEQDSGHNGSVNTGDGENGVEAGTANGSIATQAAKNNGNDIRPESIQAPPDPALQDATTQDATTMEAANHAVDAVDMTASEPTDVAATDVATSMEAANHAVDAADMTASEPTDVAATMDQPVFTDAIGAPTLTQPVVGLAANATAEPPVSSDAGSESVAALGDGEVESGAAQEGIQEAASGETQETQEGESPVVRTARDSRLNEMAPNASMEDLLKASEQQYRTLKHGDVIEGTVMKVDRDEILVDIGSKSEGVIPSHELQSLSVEERETMKIGDELLVSVIQPENNEGHAVLSLDRARQEKSWRDLQKQFEDAEVIQAEVSGYNKGGLLVNLGGVRGFVPSSQVSSLTGNEATKQSEMSKLQGQPLPLKIIEINRSRNRLILSERQAMQEQRESMRSRLLKELEPGQVRPGQVSSICDFGAFVDIGGADGLIHLSELSWKRVSHPSEVLKVGERINVYVLSIDPNERKIALSLKRTQPEPWSTITENYQLGQVVRGTITQLTSFGAFARLEDGIEGLIHVSELAEGRVAHPRNVVKEGDVVELKVIRIDPVKKRIGLSLKRMNEDAEGNPLTGAVDDDTAAASTAETPGAYGVNDEAPVGQEDLMPAVEGTQQTSAPQQREGSRREREFQRPTQPQQRKPDPRQQPQPQPKPRSNEQNEEPMGAMAHAFAMLAQSQAAEQTQERATAQTAAETEQSAIPEVTSTDAAEPAETQAQSGPEAMMPSATDMEEKEAESGAAQEPEATSVSPEAEGELEPEATSMPSEPEGEPEAEATSMPSEPEGEPEAEAMSASPEAEEEPEAMSVSSEDSESESGATQEPEAPASSDEESASEDTSTDADTSGSYEAMPAEADSELVESAGEGDVSDIEADVQATDDADTQSATEDASPTEAGTDETSQPLG